MFAKLLKHDTKAVFKYWWLGAAISVLIAIFGGFCMKIANVENTKYTVLPTLGTAGMIFSYLGIYLLPLLTEILVLIRYYKHFFSDEGYLTFTLPVKKTTLLDSKIATSFIFTVAGLLITVLNLVVMVAIGAPEFLTSPEAFEEASLGVIYFVSLVGFLGYTYIPTVLSTLGSNGVIYVVLIVLIVLAYIIAQTLFVYACITLASSIVKKHKVITAVGIYYGVSSIIYGALQAVLIFTALTTYDSGLDLETETSLLAISFLLLGVLGVLVAVIGGLYLLLTFLLDKKLNLE